MKNTKNIIIGLLAIVLIVLAYMLLTQNNLSQDTETPTDNQNVNVSEPPTPAPQPTPQPAPAPAAGSFESKAGSNWLLSAAYAEGGAFDLTMNVPQPMTLNFDQANKAFNGFGGCNSFSGSYTASGGDKFSFGAITSTKKYCTETSALESDLFSVMSAVTKYQIAANGNLVLSNADGSTRIEYKPAI